MFFFIWNLLFFYDEKLINIEKKYKKKYEIDWILIEKMKKIFFNEKFMILLIKKVRNVRKIEKI